MATLPASDAAQGPRATAAGLHALADALIARDQRVAFAESCTGGLIAKLATDLAGSSAWFECGLVTYSNRAKHNFLDVPEQVFETDGAVSRACALAMVDGLLRRTGAHWGAAVTGIAGPGGGSADKPVGTVWIGWAGGSQPAAAEHFHFSGDRAAIREQAAEAALVGLIRRLQDAG